MGSGVPPNLRNECLGWEYHSQSGADRKPFGLRPSNGAVLSLIWPYDLPVIQVLVLKNSTWEGSAISIFFYYSVKLHLLTQIIMIRATISDRYDGSCGEWLSLGSIHHIGEIKHHECGRERPPQTAYPIMGIYTDAWIRIFTHVNDSAVIHG